MADAVTSNVYFTQTNGTRRYGIHLTCISDGTGETNVAKVVKANLKTTDGAAPNILKLASARWTVSGFAYVKFSMDHDTDDVFLLCAGNGYDNWESASFLPDPNSTGGTGDLLLTSVGAVAGAVAGIMVAHIVYLDPNMMAGILLYAFASALVGGISNPAGAVAGGFIVGVLENMVAYAGNQIEKATGIYIIGNGEKLTVALIIVIFVLTVKPAGLFGRVVVKRV